MTPGGRGTIYAASRVVADAATTYSPGAVAVINGVVAAVGGLRDVEREVPAGFDRADLPGLVLLPGLVNSHTHFQIPRFPDPGGGAGKSLSFVDWILRVIEWRLRAPAGEFAENAAAAAREAIAGGTTTIGEIAGPDIDAYATLPLRARVFAEGIGFPPAVAEAARSSVEKAVARIAGFPRAGGMVAPGISPHALYTVGLDLLRGLAGLGARLGLPLVLHLAESPAEMEFLATGEGKMATRLYPAVGMDVSFFRGIGGSVPEYLRRAGILRDRPILVHNVHLSRGEIDELRAGGAGFVLCPRSNAAHRNGLPDVTYFVDAGIPFALGTDSLGSVGTVSLWDEMRVTAGLYRGNLSEENLCRSLFRAASENGARLLGLSTGTLFPGAPADFAAVDDPCREEAGWLFSRLVDRGEDRNVRLTVIAGERIHERPG